MCQKDGFEKDWKKINACWFPEMHRNGKLTHSLTVSVTLISLFSSPFSLWATDRQDKKAKSQTVDYILYSQQTSTLQPGNSAHTHIKTHARVCRHRLQWRGSHCQKTVEEGDFGQYLPAALLPVCLCDITSDNLTCTADMGWWKMFSQRNLWLWEVFIPKRRLCISLQ